MKYLIAAFAMLCTASLSAATPNFCDQSFSGVLETQDHDMVGLMPPVTGFAVPYSDVQDNHDKHVKVVAELAKQQNQGGPYTVTVSEVINCDGTGNVRVPTGSLYAEGVTYKGLNKINREGLKQAEAILKRNEDREEKGAKTAWNHKNAKKVERDEAGQVVPPGQAKKQ